MHLKKAFGDKTKFFEGESLESALSHLHRVQKFLGMSPLKSFACYDVVKNPDIEKFLVDVKNHLEEVIQ